MDLDTTPATVLVTSVVIKHNVATMRAVDLQGFVWSVTLEVGRDGARRWFAETIKNAIAATRLAYRMTSVYDEAKDEWFTTAGNYGIKSSSLHFTEVEED